MLRTDYLLIGADIRGIDQNNDLNGSSSARTVFNNEDLNTTYYGGYGGYVGFGGEYSLGFLGSGGPWESLGLRSYFSARAGLYDAAIDYDVAFQFIPVNSRLSLSKDDLAFIGSVSFETRKQFVRARACRCGATMSTSRRCRRCAIPTAIAQRGSKTTAPSPLASWALEYRSRPRASITNRSNRASRSELAQRHRLDRVIRPFAQDQIGTQPRRQDIVSKIDEIDRAPQRQRGGACLVL